jgi:hypothetical protein
VRNGRGKVGAEIYSDPAKASVNDPDDTENDTEESSTKS